MRKIIAKIIATNEIKELEECYLKDNDNLFFKDSFGKIYYPHDLEFHLTDTLIKDLAEQYAESMCPENEYQDDIDDELRNIDLQIYKDDALNILKWLSINFKVILKAE